MGAWVHGRTGGMGAWVQERMGAWVHGRMGAPVRRAQGTVALDVVHDTDIHLMSTITWLYPN